MKIYLVRHAQTEANLKRFIQGQSDTSVTELGYEQTKLTAAYFKNVGVTQIYCSPLGRTVKTAKLISLAAQFPVEKIKKCSELMEIDLKPWVGRAIDELEQDKTSGGYATYKNHPDKFVALTGEGFEDVKKRTSEVFEKIVSESTDDSVIVIVSHSVAIRTLLLYLENESVSKIWNYQVKPASITLVESNKVEHNIKFVGHCPYLE